MILSHRLLLGMLSVFILWGTFVLFTPADSQAFRSHKNDEGNLTPYLVGPGFNDLVAATVHNSTAHPLRTVACGWNEMGELQSILIFNLFPPNGSWTFSMGSSSALTVVSLNPKTHKPQAGIVGWVRFQETPESIPIGVALMEHAPLSKKELKRFKEEGCLPS